MLHLHHLHVFGIPVIKINQLLFEKVFIFRSVCIFNSWACT